MGFLTTCAKMLFEESNMIEIIKESISLNIGQSIGDTGAVEWIKVMYCDCLCDTYDDDDDDDVVVDITDNYDCRCETDDDDDIDDGDHVDGHDDDDDGGGNDDGKDDGDSDVEIILVIMATVNRWRWYRWSSWC